MKILLIIVLGIIVGFLMGFIHFCFRRWLKDKKWLEECHDKKWGEE